MKPQDEQIKVLQEMLAEHEHRLEEAQEIVKREEPICHHLRHLIGSMKPGAPVQASQEGASPGGNPLTRKPEFATGSLLDAVERILAGSKQAIHADDLTKRIFVLRDKSELARAKNALVSDMVRGVKRGRFRRTGKNLYALPNGETRDVAA